MPTALSPERRDVMRRNIRHLLKVRRESTREQWLRGCFVLRNGILLGSVFLQAHDAGLIDLHLLRLSA